MLMRALKKKIHRVRHSLFAERARSLLSRPAKAPIFVFGNQKSGTSVIAGLLGAASGLRAQIDFLGAREPYLTPFLRGKPPIDKFVRINAWPFSAPIVKEPSLTFVAAKLMDHFGVDKGIFVVRDPFRNIKSILTRLKVPGDLDEFSPTPSNMPNATWVSIMSGTDLGLTADHYIEIQAERWVRAVQSYLDAPERYVLIRYEDFLEDKAAFIRELALRLGMAADGKFDHLVDHQFQRSRNSAIEPEQFFGQRNFQRIAAICQKEMIQFRYGV